MSHRRPSDDRDAGPGVPEAVPRVLRALGERLGVRTIDRIWVFPPLVRGRREWGLVAASRTVRSEDAPDAEVPDHEAPVGDVERRTLFSAHYTAERTGTGLHLDVTVREQGEAPPDRLPRVMDGVVRRSGDDLGEPREVEIGGDVDRFETLMDEFDPGLFEEPAQPMPASQS